MYNMIKTVILWIYQKYTSFC